MSITRKMYLESAWSNTFGASLANLITGSGDLVGLHIHNEHPADIYIQVFDALAANVTLGTTSPKFSFEIPAGGSREENPGTMGPIHFNTAISYAATTESTGGTAASTSPVRGKLLYKSL